MGRDPHKQRTGSSLAQLVGGILGMVSQFGAIMQLSSASASKSLLTAFSCVEQFERVQLAHPGSGGTMRQLA